jgi:hypothetical protein
MVLGAAGATRSQQSAAGTQRIVQFKIDDVKVWRSIVVPNTPLTMHRHEHERVIIPPRERHHEDRRAERRERGARSRGLVSSPGFLLVYNTFLIAGFLAIVFSRKKTHRYPVRVIAFGDAVCWLDRPVTGPWPLKTAPKKSHPGSSGSQYRIEVGEVA